MHTLARFDLRARRLATLVVAPVLALCGACTAAGGAVPGVEMLASPAQADHAAQSAAAEAFYRGGTAAELEAAVEAARRAGPDSALFHELAATLELLRADPSAQFDHLLSALLDPGNDAAHLHFVMLESITWTLSELRRTAALCEQLAARHPDPALRARAAFLLAELRFQAGDVEGAEQASAAAGLRLPMAIIGSWDNDEGKGFDVELPPEREIDLSARYEGSLLEIGWRPEPPRSPFAQDYDLGAMLNPSAWGIAYAASAVRAPAAGDYELRVLSSVPLKVWINGALLYEERRIEGGLFDQLVLPMRLRRGVNRVLVKSAQNTGGWTLLARVTGPGGAQVAGLEAAPPDAPAAEGEAPGGPYRSEQLVVQRVAALPQASARQAYHALAWTRSLGFRNLAVTLGDEVVQTLPDAIAARYLFAGALWDHDERGRTDDLLKSLDRAAGDQLTLLRLQHARFLGQEKLLKEARRALLQARDAHPDSADVRLRLAWLFDAEGWTEDQCEALEEARQRRPEWLSVSLELVDCLDDLGFEGRAGELAEEILAALPNHYAPLRTLQSFALGNEQLSLAEELAGRLVRALPHQPWTWMRLGEVRRRLGDREGAEQAYEHARELAPDSPAAWEALARIAYQHGDRELAVERWKAALLRDPSDEKLLHRLSYLGPDRTEPWEEEAPSREELDAIVAARAAVKPVPGADLVYLLDHEVTRINPDGSTNNVVTEVLHAVNESGRDKLTKVPLRNDGRVRVLQAFAVDPAGERLQASSIRGRTARFRGLKVGSTVVLQYRHDAGPVGYLSRHVARHWWFQGSATQTRLSTWVVWAPRGTRFHEWLSGDIDRQESEHGDQVRVAWSAADVAPVIGEPYMPGSSEVALNMLMSTVPDWETFLEWEKALLHEAFRESAEVKQLAEQLLSGIEAPEAKLMRIHRYIMEEIRYQQDYEDHIAGVKPHAAPVVVKQGYGDCKDKAVLFITLARLAGLDARFAVVRTRSRGPLRHDVPMQQFNHAIVYVPAQKGIAAGRFYDPTADALDVDVLAGDDAGATALVLDAAGAHEWIEVPFQAAALNDRTVSSRFTLRADGAASGSVTLVARGMEGSILRRVARNERQLQQALQMFVSHAYPNATTSEVRAEEVTDLTVPAKVGVTVEVPTYGRIDGEELRFTAPRAWSPDAVFHLAERKYPLVLGVPLANGWRSEIELPAGAKVVRLPKSAVVEAPCFRYEREVTSKGERVFIDQRFETRCERIAVDAYAEHRARAEEISKLYKEEVCLKLPRKVSRK